MAIPGRLSLGLSVREGETTWFGRASGTFDTAPTSPTAQRESRERLLPSVVLSTGRRDRWRRLAAARRSWMAVAVNRFSYFRRRDSAITPEVRIAASE